MRQNNWFRLVFQLKGSVIGAIYQRVIGICLFAFFISVLNGLEFPVAQPVGPLLTSMSIILGLLLVFRTNTAYDRYWEGRKLWGSLANDILNLAMLIRVIIEEVEPEDRTKKIAALRLLSAFAIATKLYLRSESVNSELEQLMTPEQYLRLQNISNPPLEIGVWIEEYLQQQFRLNRISNAPQIAAVQSLMRSIVDSQGNYDRILKTPLPLAYNIHLKQLLLLYCLVLPFQIVKDFGWGTVPVIALVSFTILGIEEIGIEIENPFGYDPNDLPLDDICNGLKTNIENLIN